MSQALLVDERVRGDHDSDRQADGDAFRAASETAHEYDSGADEADPQRLAGGDGMAEHDGRTEQHEHGRRAARDRIDDGELASAVRGDEQEEVRSLERRRS